MKNKDYREYIENRSDQLMGIDISLKQFLVNVLNILEKNEHGINPDEFTLMIERSLNGSSDIAIETFKDCKPPNLFETENKISVFLETIKFQIYELHQMEVEGTLKKDLIEFGIDSPRGHRWYNFNVYSYLECSSGWLIDYSGEEATFSTDWDDLANMFEMGRLYE